MRAIAAAMFLVPCILLSVMGKVVYSGGFSANYWYIFGLTQGEDQLRTLQLLLGVPGLYFLVTSEVEYWRQERHFFAQNVQSVESDSAKRDETVNL